MASDPSAQDVRRRVDALLQRALDLPAAARKDFLQRSCPEDLRSKVERLLSLSEGDETLAQEAETRAGWDPRAVLQSPLVVGMDDAARPPSERIGPYRLVEELGRGGMGVVYLAERADGQFDQRVALKVARSAILVTDDALLRFKTERQILAALEHPSIARLLDGGVTEQGLPYFVMEMVEGEPIDRYCDKRRLSLRCRLELFLDVASAVDAAHRKLVVHRDIKPSNVMVSETGAVKLLDFGIAKPLDPSLFETRDVVQTQDALSVMTPAYASPEQFRGELISIESDVYQLGALLYLMLTGSRPYRTEGLPMAQVVLKICDEPVTAPSRRLIAGAGEGDDDPSVWAAARGTDQGRLQRALAGDLDTIVLKALRKEPARRYASAAALADDVRRYLDGRPVLARGDAWTYRIGKLLSRHRGAALATCLGLLSAASLLSWVAVERHRAADRAELSRHLGEELKDMEWRFRVAQMAPLHSIEEEKRRIRDRIEALSELGGAIGERAVGPVAYAVGRGHLLLGEPRRAVDHLRAAHDSDYRNHSSETTLALAFSATYLQEQERIQLIADPQARRVAQGEAEKAWRDPALALLDKAPRNGGSRALDDGSSGRRDDGADRVSATYLSAVADMLRGDRTAAIGRAAQAAKETPWLFEAHLLRARLLRLDAVDAFYGFAGDGRDAELVRRASEAYRRVIEIAASAYEGYAGACDMAGLGIHVALHHPVEHLDTFLGLISACEAVIRVEPGNADAWRLYSDAESARVDLGRRTDPTLSFTRAAELLAEAARLAPDDPDVAVSTGALYAKEADHKWAADLDPRTDIERSLEYFQKALDLRPGDPSPWNHIGRSHRLAALYQLKHGLDASKSTSAGVGIFLRTLEREPKGIDVQNLLRALELRRRHLSLTDSDGRAELLRALGVVEGLPEELEHRDECLLRIRAWLDQAVS